MAEVLAPCVVLAFMGLFFLALARAEVPRKKRPSRIDVVVGGTMGHKTLPDGKIVILTGERERAGWSED